MNSTRKHPGAGRSDAKRGPDATGTCLAVGWTLVAGSLAFGLLLESFHLAKLPFYLDIHLRRELWTLAHAHGTLMGTVAAVFALSAGRLVPDAASRDTAARRMTWGAVLVPAGFLGGGIANAEGDPSLAILLVPIGALMAFAALWPLARGAWTAR